MALFLLVAQVASCAQTADGSPATGRCVRLSPSVTSTVVHGAEKEWHTNRFSPSRVHRNRAVERRLDVPCASVTCFERHVEQIVAILGTTWNSHAAPNTGTVRRLVNLFSFVKEFIEVILRLPPQAQRWISLGNRGSRCTLACSSARRGSLLQRVSFHTWTPSASAVTYPLSTRCEVNSSRSRSRCSAGLM